MATAKIITWPRPNKDGHYPIGIKIVKHGKPSYIFEGYTLTSRDLWDAKKQEVKKSVPNSARLTNYLRKKLSEVSDLALEMETKKMASSAQAIKQKIKPSANDNRKPETFRQVAEQYLKEQKACGNYDVYTTDMGRLKRFYEFAGKSDLAFTEITVEFLRQYTVFLRSQKKRNLKGEAKPLSERTITNHILIIRTLYNRAVTAKLVSLDGYPFGGKGGISIKFGRSTKIGLNATEVKQIEQVVFPENYAYLNDTRNLWLTAFYFAGMRITDALLLKWSDFQNGRFYYTMSKNGEPGSLKVPEKVLAILDQYRNDPAVNDLVFPHLKTMSTLENRFELRRRVSFVTKTLGEHMEKMMKHLGIAKNASPHKARHTFAQRAEVEEIHPKVLQKLYRHESILTTMNYQSNFSHEKADAAVDAVIGF